MIRSLLPVVAIAALAACQTRNPNYCPDDAGMCGSPGDGSSGGRCSSDSDCKTADFPACDLTVNQCKPCTASNPGVCTGTNAPHCDSNACAACVDDRDCSNGAGVCLATGGCALPGQIIHADSTKAGSSDCGDGILPACSLTGALGLVAPGKNVIKLDDVGPFLAEGFMVTNDVTIDARVNGGATLSRSNNGPVITVMGGKSFTLLGGIVHGTAGKDSDGINCSGSGSTLVVVDTKVENNDQSGINADTCTLNLTRVTVSNNSKKAGAFAPGIIVNKGSISLAQSRIDSNNGGGLSITNAVFQIVGNVFSNNGPPGTAAMPDPPSPVGGISITAPANSANRLDFNTITGNHAQAGNGPGLQCTAGGLNVRNNIIYGNNDNLASQFGGNCQPVYSDLGFITIDTNNNTHADPMFGTAFHLTANSALLGKADPSSDLTGIAAKDIDGEKRIKRSGAGADIGADQFSP